MKNAIYTYGNQRQPGIPGQVHWSTRERRRYEERQARRKKKSDPGEITISINLWSVLRGALAGAAFLTLVILGFLGNHLATLLAAICAVWHCWRGKSAG